MHSGPLGDKKTIVIIGGGPAGSSCAIKLKKLCAQANINPRIIVYEGKLFEKKRHYNQCLGVLSPPLEKVLENDLGIPFPWEIVQKTINGYYIYSENNQIKLSGEHEPSYACRRIEFDHYLFLHAKKLGLEIIPARVTELDFTLDGVMVFSESNNVKADVVVGAFGLDDGMAKIFERTTSYRPPTFISSIVTKIHPGEERVEKFGNYLHAFLPSSLPEVEFGAITPKGNHLSLNIAGKKVNTLIMAKFLNLPAVRKVLPDNIDQILPHLYYFKGKFPTLPAKNFFGNRYVMIGDAAGLNRPLKGKGINSAVMTGIKAAEVIKDQGYSESAFSYYVKSSDELLKDIPYGKSFRFITNSVSRLELLDSILEVAKNDALLRDALFHIVSGQDTYKNIWTKSGKFPFLIKIGLKSLWKKFSIEKTKNN